MGSKTKTCHVNMLKKYISREPEGNVVTTVDYRDRYRSCSRCDTPGRRLIAGEVPDLEGYRLCVDYYCIIILEGGGGG